VTLMSTYTIVGNQIARFPARTFHVLSVV